MYTHRFKSLVCLVVLGFATNVVSECFAEDTVVTVYVVYTWKNALQKEKYPPDPGPERDTPEGAQRAGQEMKASGRAYDFIVKAEKRKLTPSFKPSNQRVPEPTSLSSSRGEFIKQQLVAASTQQLSVPELAEEEVRIRKILQADEILLLAKQKSLADENDTLTQNLSQIVEAQLRDEDTSQREAEYKEALAKYEPKAAEFNSELQQLAWNGMALEAIRTKLSEKVKEVMRPASNFVDAPPIRSKSEASVEEPLDAMLRDERVIDSVIGTWTGMYRSNAGAPYTTTLQFFPDGRVISTTPSGRGGRGNWKSTGNSIEVTWTTGARSLWNLQRNQLSMRRSLGDFSEAADLQRQ